MTSIDKKHKKSEIEVKRRFLSFLGREMKEKQHVVCTGIDGEWFPFDWPYILENEFPVFFVTLSSHMNIEDTNKNWTELDLPRRVKDWFDTYHRKQIGAHLLTTRLGRVQMVYMTVDPKNDSITTSEAQDVNSVYPVLRNEAEVGQQKLIIGLFFGNCDKRKYRKSGNRLHFKYDYSWLEIDNCWELHEQMFDEKFFRQWYSFENRPHFALFVSPSARLLVSDNCVPKGRTRSLIQQGGVVVVEGELRFRVKELDFSYSLEDCVRDGVLVPPVKGWNPKDFPNPVLFLGASESEYDSISWDLLINQRKDENSTPNFTLMIPDGGYIDAIVQWTEGIEEIWARHSYQRLYESNVIQPPEGRPISTTEFRVPGLPLLSKIIGGSETRAFKCNHRPKLSQQLIKVLDSQPPLPLMFNFRKIKKAIRNVIANSKGMCGLSIPPAYPPIEHKVNNVWHYLHLPNNMDKKFSDDIHRHYTVIEFDGIPERCLRYHHRIYRLKKNRMVMMDEFVSEKHSEQFADKSRAERYALCDGIKTRLGADGWIYTHTGKVISIYETQYYYLYK